MQKIFLIGMIFSASFLSASPSFESKDSDGESSEFWPCDWIPHPHPPGSGPSDSGEPEMA